MSDKTLFLAWQDKREESRLWFPIGRLDANVKRSLFRFRYTGGAKRAEKEAGFPLLIEFPQLQQDYQSSELFPLFRNRVIAPGGQTAQVTCVTLTFQRTQIHSRSCL